MSQHLEYSVHDPRPIAFGSGNTPPTDLLQHVPRDAPRADILSLGCGDVRDVLYSILLHGLRLPVLSFTLNDWEPAIHARNLILLQMILDSRQLLEACGHSTEINGAIRETRTAGIRRRMASGKSTKSMERSAAKGNAEAAFATSIGVIFR